jgi:hypothetical protein
VCSTNCASLAVALYSTLHHHIWTVFWVWLLCVVELYDGVYTVVAENFACWMSERRDSEVTPMSVAVLDTTHIMQARAFLTIFTYAQERHISVNFLYTTHCTTCFESHYADFRLHSHIPTVSKLVRRSKAKCKVPVHAIGGSRGIAPLIPKLGIRKRWGVSFTFGPLYPLREPWHALNMKIRGPQSLFGYFGDKRNNMALPGFKRPAKSLQWLR